MGLRLRPFGGTLGVRYMLAVGVTAASLGFRVALQPVLGFQAPFATFYLGTVLVAYWLGTGPALLASGLGCLLTAWFFIEPLHSLAVQGADNLAWVSLYIVICLAIIYAADRQRKAERLAAANAELAQRRYHELLAETKAREEAQKAEERQRRWAEVTLASIGDAVVATDSAGTVTYLNEVAERLTGWAACEATGKPIQEVFQIVSEETRDRAEIPVEKVLRTGTVQGLANHTILIARGGTEVPIDDSAAPIRDADGALAGVVLVFRDITDRRRTEQELRRSNEDLQRFAYVASHDLQQPLRMVASFVGLLQSRYAGRLDEQADRYIQFAVDGAQRMQNLIRDLLEYSRAGTQQLNLARVDLNRTVEDIQVLLGEQIGETGTTVRCGSLPVIEADELKITQVLQNLIANAIKFRGERPPQVALSAEQRGNEWLFRVQDNGIGFDSQYADRIFVMFERLHGAARYCGNGIGLAICKRVVEMHGGRIWAESRPGEGSTFCFTLPVESRAGLERKATA